MPGHRLELTEERLLEFWRERHLCTFTSVRPDGTPHVVPTGSTLDAGQGIARVITSGGSAKARYVGQAGPDGLPVAICQADGRRWATIEGRAFVRKDPAEVRDAERRYAERYRTPRVNPARVVIEIKITRVLGSV